MSSKEIIEDEELQIKNFLKTLQDEVFEYVEESLYNDSGFFLKVNERSNGIS